MVLHDRSPFSMVRRFARIILATRFSNKFGGNGKKAIPYGAIKAQVKDANGHMHLRFFCNQGVIGLTRP